MQAVVVAFNPGPSLERLCATLIASGMSVLVVDNASTSGIDVLVDCCLGGVEVVRLTQNAGISGALALGHARSIGHLWMLTFDQDSEVDGDHVRSFLASAAVSDPQVAIVAPIVLDATNGHLLQGSPNRDAPYTVPLAITSGALCRIGALNDVVGFREDLFIDHVDHDICLRLRRQGWRIAIEPTVSMRHSIGTMRTDRIAGVGIRNSHHAPDRQYYKYRNFILLVRAGTARTDVVWALRTLLALTWAPLKILAFEEDKAAKYYAITTGVRDGLRKRAGRRPTPSRQS